MIAFLKFMVLVLVWYACGVSSWIYWITRESDFTRDDVKDAALVGLLGPIVWGFGAWCKFFNGKNYTIFPKK